MNFKTQKWYVDAKYPCLVRTPSRVIAKTAPYGSIGLPLKSLTDKDQEQVARLISAAPDLLNALTLLRDEIVGNIMYDLDPDSQGNTDKWLGSMIEVADKALKKAKGF